MKKGILIGGLFLIGLVSLTSCSTQRTVDALVEKKVQEYIEAHQDDLKGDKGDKGIQGIQGIAGANGTDGKDGKDGLNGKDGVDGKDGKDGINGINGKDGVDGKDGINGINGTNGKDGKDGIDGKDGLTPYIGTNGNWWIGDEDTGVMSRGEIIVKNYTKEYLTDVVELNVNNFLTYIDIRQVESSLSNCGKILLVKPCFYGSLSYAYYDNVEITYQLDGKEWSRGYAKDFNYTGTTILSAGGYSLLPYEVEGNFNITIIDIKGKVLY